MSHDENSQTFVAAHLRAPADAAARTALAERGLDLSTVPHDDRAAFDRWLEAMTRGFLGGERTQVQRDAAHERLGYRRLIGVFDTTAPEPETPVGTFASWVAELTVPGGAIVPACAVSSVTVAPTHHRRGIARAMMEGELRHAAAVGVPIATLTVSESTLYGRYGFAPAAAGASWRIEARRAGWVGPEPAGRVDFISRERWREIAPAVHERLRPSRPGELSVPPGHWDGFARTRPDAEEAGKLRAVQYTDAEGAVRGVALYTLSENHDDFTKWTVDVAALMAETDDASAALWRFLLQLDLVAEVRAGELAVDEALLWMIADQRAATVTVTDHHYVRILDVPAALTARRYARPGVFALDVHDPLGIGGGTFLLRIDAEGAASVDPLTGDAPTDAVGVSLGTAELSALYLGGVSAIALAAAGRLRSDDVEATASAFSWHRAPRLSYWY